MKRTVCMVLMLVVFCSAQIVEWIHSYNGPDNQSEVPYDIAVDNFGNVFVGGYGYLAATYMDCLMIKYADGDTLWCRYYDGGLLFYDRIHAVAVDDSGNVYATGLSMETAGDWDLVTMKYNGSGVLQWLARYDGPGNDDDEGNDIAVDDSGNVYVCGYTRSSATYTDYVVIKYNSSGDTMWTAMFDGPYSGIDIAYALVLDDSGNVYVTGEGNSSTYDPDYYTVKVNAQGDIQWVVEYDGPVDFADDRAYDIALGGGYIYVTGESEGDGSELDYATIKYSAAGDTVWELRYNGPGGWDDVARAIAADSFGNVYVTGESMGLTTLRDYATIKYSASGIQEWVSRYDGPDHDDDEGIDIVLDVFGNVYVVGQSYALGSVTPEYDFLTVKYNAAGVEQWTHRYDGTGHANDHPAAITTDSEGNVYITGRSTGNVGYDDYVTIKYGVTGISEETGYDAAAAGFSLTAYPNPFSRFTGIRFTMYDSQYMIDELRNSNFEMRKPSLKIYDASGRMVKSFDLGSSIQDQVSMVVWDGTDQAGREMGSGVYFIRADAGYHHATQQVLLVR